MQLYIKAGEVSPPRADTPALSKRGRDASATSSGDDQGSQSSHIEGMKSSQRRARMGQAAREEALKHSWRASTEALVDFYTEAIERHWRDHVPAGPMLKLVGAADQRALRLPPAIRKYTDLLP